MRTFVLSFGAVGGVMLGLAAGGLAMPHDGGHGTPHAAPHSAKKPAPASGPKDQLLIGADVYIGELNQLVQFGRVGNLVGLLGDAPVCNAGDAPLDWLTGVAERHPFMNWNMYRLREGRLIQIGQSWTKHGLGASQDDECNFGCQPYPTADRLGVGCSDTYMANFNNNTIWSFGPRHEVNPWTGQFTFPGSHTAQGNHAHTDIAHRLQVSDAHLDPATNAGATYIHECYVLAWDDADPLNSIAHKTVLVSGAPGGTWTFNLNASTTVMGPAILAWPGATITAVPLNSPPSASDGRVYLAVRPENNPNGSWFYLYAIYNHDMDRGIGAFTVPHLQDDVPATIGTYAVRSHDVPYTNTNWAISLQANTVNWATDPHSVNPFSNPIRWGTMYNFWFNSLAAPGNVTATLAMFKPGSPAQMTAQTLGPAVARKLGDAAPPGGDGIVNVNDLLAVINAWGECPPPEPNNCLADVAPPPAGDGIVNVNDLLLVINNWG